MMKRSVGCIGCCALMHSYRRNDKYLLTYIHIPDRAFHKLLSSIYQYLTFLNYTNLTIGRSGGCEFVKLLVGICCGREGGREVNPAFSFSFSTCSIIVKVIYSGSTDGIWLYKYSWIVARVQQYPPLRTGCLRTLYEYVVVVLEVCNGGICQGLLPSSSL